MNEINHYYGLGRIVSETNELTVKELLKSYKKNEIISTRVAVFSSPKLVTRNNIDAIEWTKILSNKDQLKVLTKRLIKRDYSNYSPRLTYIFSDKLANWKMIKGHEEHVLAHPSTKFIRTLKSGRGTHIITITYNGLITISCIYKKGKYAYYSATSRDIIDLLAKSVLSNGSTISVLGAQSELINRNDLIALLTLNLNI